MQQQILKHSDRLIVAADFKPAGRVSIRDQVLRFADQIAGTGVYIKVGSALRTCGYDLISEIRARGLRVFADLKLFDTKETLLTDGMILEQVGRPEILTVVCAAGVSGMHTLNAELPYTEILGVTVLTSFNDADTLLMFGRKTEETVLQHSDLAVRAGLDGVIASPVEANMLRAYFGSKITINTPAIRPFWAKVEGDDQNSDRVMTPSEAIKAGSDRVIVGRPIVLSANPNEAVKRTLEEIEHALTVKIGG